MMGGLEWPKALLCGAGRRLSLTRRTDEDEDTRYSVSGEGPPLLLLRRSRGGRLRLARVLTELPRTHRVYAPNLPDFSGSAMPTGIRTLSFWRIHLEAPRYPSLRGWLEGRLARWETLRSDGCTQRA